MRRTFLILIALAYLLAVSPLYAQSAPDQGSNATAIIDKGVLQEVADKFLSKAKEWQAAIFSAASYIFWTLGTISLVWTGISIALRKGDFGEFIAEFFKFSIFFGFMLWLLNNGPAFASTILNSMIKLATQAGNIAAPSPDDIVSIAYYIFTKSLTAFSLASPAQGAVIVLISVVVLYLLVSIAINFLLIQISGYLVMYAGIFVLGFGGSRWTSEMAINYYKTVLGIGVQILVCILLVGIGTDLLSSYQQRLTQGTLSYQDLAVLLIFSLVLRELSTKIPPMVAGMISGATGGQQIGAASAAGVAAATAAYAGTALATAAQTAGAGSAVIAAVKSAMAAQASSGGDVVARMRESASLAGAFPSRSGSGEASSPSRGGSSSASSRPSSVDQAAGKSSSDSSRVPADAPSKTSQGPSASADRDVPSSSTSQDGASVGTPDAPASQAPSQDSGSPLSSSPVSLASEAPANSSFPLQDGPSSSNGSGNGSAPNESSESSLQSSRETMSSASKPLAQNLSASTGPAKPWEVADGQVPTQDISQMAASPQSPPSPSPSSNSDQPRQHDPVQRDGDQAGQAGSDTPARKSSTGRFARVAIGAAGHLASGTVASMKNSIVENTVGGRIAATINARREEAAKRGEQNRNYIASAGPEFHAEVQELLDMNQKVDS